MGPWGGVVRGDARQLPLRESSIQCVVTSPPYWGLRDYGLPPSVWGGDPACGHGWMASIEARGRSNWDSFNEYRQDGYNNRSAAGKTAAVEESTKATAHGAFCACGAWRGTLGLEPTPELYVQHLVAVFREVRRVLRGDGTCWVNLGDSYAGSGSEGR